MSKTLKFDFSQTFKEPSTGKVVVRSQEDPTPVTLGRIAYNALNAPGERPLNHSEAVKAGTLALDLDAGGIQEISKEDVDLIKAGLPRAWLPVMCVLATRVFDNPLPAPAASKTKEK